MAETLNIYQKLAKIRKPVEVLQKNKSGYNYKYVTEDLLLSKITGLMGKLEVSLIPKVIPGTMVITPYSYTKTRATKDGKVFEEKVNEILVSCEMEWHWVNNENPDDRVIVPWAMVGQQSDASQAFGSGLSYCTRYFLLKYFNVATSDDDPDKWRSAQKEAEETEEREIAQGIVEQIHIVVTEYLEGNPEKRSEIIDVIKKYAKKNGKASGNYRDITNSVTASNLLQDITNNFINKEK